MKWFIVEKAEITHCLFATSPIVSLTCDMETIGFPSLKHGGAEYIKEKGNYLFVKKDWENTGKKYLKLILDNPEVLGKIHQEIKELEKEFLIFCKELLETNFSSKGSSELGDLYNKFEKLRNDMHYRRGPLWIMETGSSGFSEYVINYLKSEIEKQGLDLVASVVFAVLSTPLARNFTSKEKIDFLKIAIKLKDEENYDLSEEIKDHSNKYEWLPYGLSGPAWDNDHFVKAMRDLLGKSKEELQKELDEILSEHGKIRKQKEEILQVLKIDEKHKRIIELAEETIELRGSSKDLTFFGYYAAENLFKVIASRLEISLDQLRKMQPWEIKPALIAGTVDKEELQKRWEYCFHYCEGGKSKVYSGNGAREFVKTLDIQKEEKVDKNISELKGNCARQGYAKGKVKIINNPKDLYKMEEGDILVSYMTDPEIVIAMKKAAAIVTDMGGITCHAAIVSRELGKPCVIGTKIATKVFKDGDVVEVDADKGVVRKTT